MKKFFNPQVNSFPGSGKISDLLYPPIFPWVQKLGTEVLLSPKHGPKFLEQKIEWKGDLALKDFFLLKKK